MVAQAAQRDGLLLYCLRVVLAVPRVVGVGVLTNVDFELWIFYCHRLFLS